MKHTIKLIFTIMIISIIHLLSSCESFLDEKPSKDLVEPKTLKDLWALLDNSLVMNSSPALGLLSSDDLFTDQNGWNAYRSPVERNAYIWMDDLYSGETHSLDWYYSYQQIFYSNVVLEILQEIGEGETESKAIEGSALFFRAHAYFNLIQLFAGPYSKETASTDLGVPLRLSSNLNNRPKRSMVDKVYMKILEDLKIAIDNLPEEVPFKTRPSKTAGLGLLSRVYLAMGDYKSAKDYAEKALALNSNLIDFSDLDGQRYYPFDLFNEEVVFQADFLEYSFLTSSSTWVDSTLYNLYLDGDLRKDVFFDISSDGNVTFRGSYTGNYRVFSGVSVPEIYLTLSECLIREGDYGKGLEVLNSYLLTRWEAGKFVPFTAMDRDQALGIVLKERRKEMVFRGLRWMDLRRLNKDPDRKKDIVRELDGTDYVLEAESNKYVLPIPPDEVDLAGLLQNLR
ncbi:RagB/SusD family nutrient uptake outer membrane protein [Echinicola marina]|uniref:RagB/SusD family nutrient uptake outer membrane protein n=1 Tax=Echinicola marina TaxID=2859768 RepID=UPI001CF64FF3|nr:RagB/SusD family nutrient uptake outer membrane protein [Echinicola marina]UCS95043.1 RagB/SusD family nutrient uptake outer membrane protein [Echinicola marina]